MEGRNGKSRSPRLLTECLNTPISNWGITGVLEVAQTVLWLLSPRGRVLEISLREFTTYVLVVFLYSACTKRGVSPLLNPYSNLFLNFNLFYFIIKYGKHFELHFITPKLGVFIHFWKTNKHHLQNSFHLLAQLQVNIHSCKEINPHICYPRNRLLQCLAGQRSRQITHKLQLIQNAAGCVVTRSQHF